MTNDLFFEWKRKFDQDLQEKMDPLKQLEVTKRRGKLTGTLLVTLLWLYYYKKLYSYGDGCDSLSW